MTKKLFFIIAFYSSINCYSQLPEEYASDTYAEPPSIEKLKGKIKTLTETSFSVIYKFGEIVKGEILEESIYKYDLSGKEIEKISKDKHADEIQYVFKYNKKGALIEKNVYDLVVQKLLQKNIFKYNDYGKKMEEARYHSDGSLYYKYTFEFDINKNMIKKNLYETDGENSRVYRTYEYDNNGNMIKEIIHEVYTTQNIFYEYNDKNQISQEINSSWNLSFLNSYDENGNLTEKKRNNEPYETYKYDSKNNIIESIGYEFDYNYTFKNKYDTKENLIKIIRYNNNKADVITERKIIYY